MFLSSPVVTFFKLLLVDMKLSVKHSIISAYINTLSSMQDHLSMQISGIIARELHGIGNRKGLIFLDFRAAMYLNSRQLGSGSDLPLHSYMYSGG